MIFTSYFYQMQFIPEEFIGIAITAKAPDWWHGLQYKKLAPTYDILMSYKEGRITEEQYIQRYQNEVLSKLNPYRVLQDLKDLSDGRDIILLCYENSRSFCHRHLVADWLTKYTNKDIKEW